MTIILNHTLLEMGEEKIIGKCCDVSSYEKGSYVMYYTMCKKLQYKSFLLALLRTCWQFTIMNMNQFETQGASQ